MPFRDEEGYQFGFWKDIGLPFVVALVVFLVVFGPIFYLEYLA